MTGAIIGDIVGSRFEFNNHKSKEFDLFTSKCFFTDDTVMTLAVAKALCGYDKITDCEKFKKTLIRCMHEVGIHYPYCGYGGRFRRWIMNKNTEPYNSFGNGSAMRVSPVAWYAESLEEAEKLAKATAEVTHNHPEGIKGAVSVTGAIFLARTGHTMDEIKRYASRFYTIDFTLDEIRDAYGFYETCQQSVPQAFEAFFESTDFEDAVRNAVSIGGDSDTIAAITGSIAEAFYGISDGLKKRAVSCLDERLFNIYIDFINKTEVN
ncbi:MAG: ADP-ribosylglycohydrolase family protein [Clostridia bacterium]|nr:ADP-ribosylglycohydrolase family protein [Clostridia bacterium]